MADDESKQLEEAKKLPWDVRFAHKSWKFRNDAYIDLASVCNSIGDPSDPRLQTFGENQSRISPLTFNYPSLILSRIPSN